MLEVLIIGAGATGLTLAIELQRRGVTFRLIDVAGGPFGGSRGKGLQPRSLEIFDMIGVADDVLAESSLYQPIQLHFGPFTKQIRSLGTHCEPTVGCPHPNMRMVPQWRTEQALRAHLTALGGSVEFGVGLQTLEQRDDVVFCSLTSGETIEARYVAGCDGGRSTTRKALELQLVGKSLGDKTMIVADFALAGLDRDFWHVWPLHSCGRIVIAPLPQAGMWQLQAPEKLARHGLEQGLFRLLKKRPSKITWRSQFRNQIRMVEHYRVGNVFLAGDSAHLHPPSGAQGLNTGVQDAFNLGWKLVSALRCGDNGILDTYEAERLPIAAAMLNLTSTLHLNSSTKRGDMTNQLSIGYRNGPLAGSEAAAGPLGLQAGDRMPDMRLSDGRRLFEAMRDGNPVQIVMTDGERILVRPDGYVAGVGKEAIKAYQGFSVLEVSSLP
ncbi:FAD-dependent monooxygenase [Novosphingobium album (ex Hu et al. 2023)]|uniref:FAD-dependent monooxygenase n=1 Tax=Novosphingobium album (ex Hu et al. 2023) TaxID=2930093 RepID=A0ABT0B5W0_9SPHN|nr:FAD-dependent monooxygenase [Novosphingobium album (ex Hu et al. 2023)]MCJ2180256.1 FAD-dependent monooxygenase [Novosphingobium album (ex Hu et al. 2023)]